MIQTIKIFRKSLLSQIHQKSNAMIVGVLSLLRKGENIIIVIHIVCYCLLDKHCCSYLVHDVNDQLVINCTTAASHV